MPTFPTLFGEASTGKVKQWSIRVFEDNGLAVIEIQHGYHNGKLQTNQKVISEGKNIGKRNETTPLQQAISEAQSQWIKKKENGYSEQLSSDSSSSTNQPNDSDEKLPISSRSKGFDADVPSVMLAHDYNKRSKDIQYPCYVQRKFDGTRCVAIPSKGLFSRNKKSHPHLQHIVQEINRLPPSFILDGELYSDTLTFQEIVGLVKRDKLTETDKQKQLQIKLYVYDIIRDQPYHLRYVNLQLLFRKYKFNHLVFVQTELCQNEEEMKQKHNQYVEEGFEGIMLRNKDGLYKGTRSADLQKYKQFFDAEYEVIGFQEGQGLEEGCVIWTCKTSDGKIFSCRPRGSREDRQEMFHNGKSYIGKKLTVRFQEETDDGLPRFPVGITFRDYE
jgi:ATP-dependent DNA ligase